MFHSNLHKFFVFMLIIGSMFIGLSGAYAQTNTISRVHSKTHAAGREQKKAVQDSTKANKGSFVPVPFIITDQNLGFGAILAIGYHSKLVT